MTGVMRATKYLVLSLAVSNEVKSFKEYFKTFHDIFPFVFKAMRPLSPAIMKVGSSSKSMMWPLVFKAPGSSTLEVPDCILELAASQNIVDIQPIPEQVVAIGVFDDASTEPVVRANIRKLNNALKRDGLDPEVDDEGSVTFAQYDAVYTMGKRRGEVWIKLADGGHPW